MDDVEILAEVEAAERRVRPHIRETPLEHAPFLSAASGADVFLKLENQQLTGSFKIRGAMNKYLSLSEEERSRPVVTASSGNHAAAVAYTLTAFGGRGVIYLPENVSKAKVEALSPYGVELRFAGQDAIVGELEAKKTAREEKWTYISPYSDPRVIGGQGTLAAEIERQGDPVDAIFVPVGGGGLISGIAGYMKAKDPSIRIIGCQPEASHVMEASVRAGRIVELDSAPTLADGTAGGVEPEAITLSVCRRSVDAWVLVSEEQIASAMRFALEKHFMLVEGAAALAIAALLAQADALRGKTVVVVVTGKKVSVDTLRRVLDV